MTGQPVCPQCSTPVELDWEWCHHCGFDPEGKRPAVTPLLSPSVRAAGGDGLGDAAPPSGLPVRGAPAPDVPNPLPTFGGLGDDNIDFSLGSGPGGGLGDDPIVAGPIGGDAGFATSSAFDDARAQPPPGGDPLGSYGGAPSFGASSLSGPGPGVPGPGGFAPMADSWGAPPPSSFGSDLLSAPTPGADGFHDPFIAQTFGSGTAPGAAPAGGFGPGSGDPGGAFGPGLMGHDLMGDPGGVAYGASLDPTSPLLPPPPSAMGPLPGVVRGGEGSSFTIPTRPMGDPGGLRPPGTPKRRAVSMPGDDSPVLKFVAIALAGILAVGAVTLVLVRAGGEERPNPSATTLDPKAPPPLGQLPLGGRTTTTAPGATPDGLAPGWVTYKSPDGSFAVNFPGNPTARGYQRTYQGFVQTGLEAWLQVGTDGPAYSTAYIELPSGGLFADSQDAFDQIMTNVADPAGDFEFAGGLHGVQFTEKASRNYPGRGVLLAKGRRIYILEAANVSDEDYDRFLRGFHWLADV